MKRVIKYIWQLPQNILGLILRGIYKPEQNDLLIPLVGENRPAEILLRVNTSFPSGISLGNYIILNNGSLPDVCHELGHCQQSQWLGPLYLIIIGIPSSIFNLYDRLFHKHWTVKDRIKWYYNLPWEKWADKLGRVKRKFN